MVLFSENKDIIEEKLDKRQRNCMKGKHWNRKWNRFTNKKWWLSFFVCFVAFVWGLGTQVYATGNNKIRVGWYEREGYMEQDAEGNVYGFGMDYLNAISEYTGWEYEFIQGTREECIENLENGIVDIMSPIGVDEELEHSWLAREIIGEDYGYLYKADNNFYVNFEAVEEFQRITLGMEEASGLEENLERYCEEKGIVFHQIVKYDSLDKMRSDLSNGKIDAFVTDSYVKLDNVKVIGRFSNARVTFATSNEKILKHLNSALENIKLDNPNFSVELMNKHFGEGAQKELEYTKEERIFLGNAKIYNVVLSGDQYPVSYRINENEYKGIASGVLEEIERQTGIEFRISYVDNITEAEHMLKDGRAQILGGVVLEKQEIETEEFAWQVQENGEFTSAFYDVELVFVGPKKTNMEAALTVAVPSYFKGEGSIKEMYPSYDFVFYKTDEECLNAILNKEADVAIQSELKIGEMIIYEKYKALQNLKYIPGNYVVTFLVDAEDPLLVSVLNKTLAGISEGTNAMLVNDNIQHIAMPMMSFGDIWLVYKWYIILAVVVIIILVTAFFTYKMYMQEKADKMRAYSDSVANIGSMEKFRIDLEPVLQSEEKLKYYAIALDIDKFKVINDLYGYENGDRVIAFLARMLQIGMKQGDYITRSNADNFVIMKKAEREEEIVLYLQKVYESIDDVIARNEAHYRMLLKAGIYPLTKDDKYLSTIIDRANIAKKNIGQIHTSTYSFYSEEMRQKNIEDKQLENDMEEALQKEQFCIYLQPQIDLETKKIVSAEALVRWKHPEKGMIPPFKFIPLFEKNGFITKLDFYVWEQSIKTVQRWRKENRIMVPIAINLSRVDVEQEGSVEGLITLMEKYQIQPQWIKTELTESICSEEDSIIMKKMQQLKEYGFKIAVDDFGSGYSSLHLLKTMPIDILKIDKSFLDIDLEADIRNEIVIRDVVEMGKHLELNIIVEGVETQEQSDFLEAIGCDIVQGYFYGKPMPIPEFEEALEKNHKGGKER